MNTILTHIRPTQIKTLYNSLFYKSSKDKTDMVLEPLQAIVQLAILSLCPIGTKLTIQENILYLQQPNVIQPISRWYNADKKDDLLFLFQVVRRFIKWYNPRNNTNSPISIELYRLIVGMAVQGLDKLIKTYSSIDCNTITQVVNMYKNLLQTHDNQDIDKLFSDNGLNMDEVFQRIISLYSEMTINIINNFLLLISNETDDACLLDFIEGFNLIIKKTNTMIKNWIKENLIF
jgi:hypothetical protein